MRTSTSWALALLLSVGVSGLTGCKQGFQGSLTGRNGDGTGPKPAPGQAQITSVSPSSVPAGGPALTITVNGANFLPTTAVLWNGNTTLTTTYVSATVLQAQVPASLTAKPTSVTLTPSPEVTFNFGGMFTVTVPPLIGNSSFSVSMVPAVANGIVWSEVDQQFYLSMASADPNHPNSITALDPTTGKFGASGSSPAEPGRVALSTDGSYVYTGLDSVGLVRRYKTPLMTPDIDINLGSVNYGPYYAIDLAAQPGSPQTVAVSRGVPGLSPQELGGVIVYDDTVARPQSVAGFGAEPGPIDTLLWNPNGQTLYGVDTETGSGLYIMAVTSAGAQLQTHLTTATGNHLHFDSTTGRLYSDAGQVLDPATGAVLGQFSFTGVQGGFGTSTIMVPDGKLNIAYFLGQTAENQTARNYVIEAYDLTHFNFLGAIAVPNVSGTPSKLIRWGTNGLAFLTGGPSGRGTTGAGVYLVSGNFVTSPAPAP